MEWSTESSLTIKTSVQLAAIKYFFAVSCLLHWALLSTEMDDLVQCGLHLILFAQELSLFLSHVLMKGKSSIQQVVISGKVIHFIYLSKQTSYALESCNIQLFHDQILHFNLPKNKSYYIYRLQVSEQTFYAIKRYLFPL